MRRRWLTDTSKIDRQDMLGKVKGFSDMLEAGLEIAGVSGLEGAGRPGSIVVSGMGGSAICGDLARAALSAPITVNRGYSAPPGLDANSVMFAVSYSGNTEETLSALAMAEKRKARIISITSGGELGKISKKKGYPLISVPKGIQPRAALPYMLSSLMVSLEKMGIAPGASSDVMGSAKSLRKLNADQAAGLAESLSGRLPVIMASEGITASAGLRWSSQINENSKMLAHLAVLPEMSHNEIVGLGSLKKGKHNMSLVVLRDAGESDRIRKRIEIIMSILRSAMPVHEVSSTGAGALERVLSLVVLGDFTSVYLALLSGVDPTPVDVIEKIKKELV